MQALADGAVAANMQVHWIDFAHTYPSHGQQDANTLQALDSLLAVLQFLTDENCHAGSWNPGHHAAV